ncbi:MAG: hypothetical protein RLZZ241_2304 [Bacteroidota bacterium]|jgi:hypothetical protein
MVLKNLKAFCFRLCFLFPLYSGAQYLWTAEVEQKGLLSGGQNAFWSSANSLGVVRPESQAITLLNGNYQTYLGELSDLKVGASAFYDYSSKGPSRLAINEAYITTAWWVIESTVGARGRETEFQGLSSVNGDLLWSNNSRPIPGLEVRTRNPMKPWRWIGLEGALAHYWLGDERFVQNAYLHYKYLGLYFSPAEKSEIKASLHHYAQWGGNSPVTGPQPTSFKDLILVFFGKNGANNRIAGNPLGSYNFSFKQTFEDRVLELYYQGLFETYAGMKTANLPDGLLGLYYDLGEEHLLKAVLLERIATNGQGSDNYFNHSVYRSGWTYQGQGLGVPFFTYDAAVPAFTNNRIVAFHMGARAQINTIEYLFKASYVKNMGSKAAPLNPQTQKLYSQLQAYAPLGVNLHLGVAVGADLLGAGNSNITLGVSLKYSYLETFRW